MSRFVLWFGRSVAALGFTAGGMILGASIMPEPRDLGLGWDIVLIFGCMLAGYFAFYLSEASRIR